MCVCMAHGLARDATLNVGCINTQACNTQAGVLIHTHVCLSVCHHIMQGKISDACAIWEAALEREKSSTGSSNKLYAYMAVHYATFLREVSMKSFNHSYATSFNSLRRLPGRVALRLAGSDVKHLVMLSCVCDCSMLTRAGRCPGGQGPYRA